MAHHMSTLPPDAEPAQTAREALRRAAASLDLAELTGSPFAMSHALAEVGRCYRGLGLLDSAEAHLEAAVRWARLAGSTDHVAELLCELADAAVRVAEWQSVPAASGAAAPLLAADAQGASAAASNRRAAKERARDRAFEVSQLVGRISDPSCEARLLLAVGAVLERCGDHADAMQMQVRALNRLGGVAPRDASLMSGFGRLADG